MMDTDTLPDPEGETPTPPKALPLLAAIIARALRPRPPMTVTDWAGQYRMMSSKDSAEPGPYRVARTPYARMPMDLMSAESPTGQVVLMFAAQTAKTTVLGNWLGYLIDRYPGPAMIIQPTLDMAKRYSRQRLAPMIEESPQIKHAVFANRSRSAANTTLLKEYPGGFLAITGANSAAGLRSMPIRDIMADEVDAYPQDVDGEGDPVMLAMARQTTFARSKTILTSTPTIRGFSRIEALFLDCDQKHHYHVPCPHCQELQALEWGTNKPHGLKWHSDKDGFPMPKTAHYVCKHCGAVFDEHHKDKILRTEREGGTACWVSDNPDGPADKMGFHLSGLYSPLGWLSWEQLVEEWHAATEAAKAGDKSLLRAFVNTRLAETWEESGEALRTTELEKRASQRPLGVVPSGGLMLTAGVDVQPDRLECRVWAWGRGERSWLVDREIIYGDPNLPEGTQGSPWQRLTEIIRTPLIHECGAPMQVEATMIDTGGANTQSAYAYCRDRQNLGVYAIKGSSQAGKPVISRPSLVDINYRGRPIAKGLKLWMLGVDTIKHLIFGRLKIDMPGPGYIDLPAELAKTDEFEQLTSERLITTLHRGHPRLVWALQSGRRNEALDCFDSATEVLTKAGWKRFADVTFDDALATVNMETDALEYQQPTHLIDKPYSGDMVRLKGERIDVLVTPNHRMVTLKKEHQRQPDGSRKWNFDVPPKITPAKDLTVHHALKITATWEGDDAQSVTIPASYNAQGQQIAPAVEVDAQDMAAFMGWWVSEGSAIEMRSKTQGNLRRRVSISQVKPQRRGEILHLLERLPWRWHEAGNSFVCTSKQLYEYVLQCGRLQPERSAPQWVKDASPRVIAAFVDAAIAGDGWTQQKKAHHRKSRAYATTSLLLANDMQELFIKLGRAATCRVVQPTAWHICGRSGDQLLTQYHVYERLASRAYLDGGGSGKRGYIGTVEHYDGRVYCATVPNGTLIVRRGWKTFVAGNCAVYAHAGAYHLGINRMREAEWQKREAKLEALATMAGQRTPAPAPEPAAPQSAPAPTPANNGYTRPRSSTRPTPPRRGFGNRR